MVAVYLDYTALRLVDPEHVSVVDSFFLGGGTLVVAAGTLRKVDGTKAAFPNTHYTHTQRHTHTHTHTYKQTQEININVVVLIRFMLTHCVQFNSDKTS